MLTLEQLIEACGDKFYGLCKSPYWEKKQEWIANTLY